MKRGWAERLRGHVAQPRQLLVKRLERRLPPDIGLAAAALAAALARALGADAPGPRVVLVGLRRAARRAAVRAEPFGRNARRVRRAEGL